MFMPGRAGGGTEDCNNGAFGGIIGGGTLCGCIGGSFGGIGCCCGIGGGPLSLLSDGAGASCTGGFDGMMAGGGNTPGFLALAGNGCGFAG